MVRERLYLQQALVPHSATAVRSLGWQLNRLVASTHSEATWVSWSATLVSWSTDSSFQQLVGSNKSSSIGIGLSLGKTLVCRLAASVAHSAAAASVGRSTASVPHSAAAALASVARHKQVRSLGRQQNWLVTSSISRSLA
jgi:hypothetical protein